MPSSSDGVEQVKRPPGTSSWSVSRATSTRSPFAPTDCRSTTPRTSSRTSSPSVRAARLAARRRGDPPVACPADAERVRRQAEDVGARSSRPRSRRAEETDAMLERLDEALGSTRPCEALSGDCREILDRFFARDESYRDDRRALDLPAGTIASRISRCLGKLREQLEGRKPAPTRLEDRERHIRIRRRASGRAAERPSPGSRWVGSGCAGASVGTARHRRDRRARRVDSEFRVRLVADLEAALAAAGYEPTDELVDAVRACLPELDQ